MVRDHVHFAVTDSGPGIPADLLPHIWEPQVRASTEAGGFGLGLYIVQQLVTVMGGSVAVTSSPGQGSQFLLTLPPDGPAPRTFAWGPPQAR